jgi:hypothetical protein
VYVIAYVHIPYSDAAELTVHYAFFDYMTH